MAGQLRLLPRRCGTRFNTGRVEASLFSMSTMEEVRAMAESTENGSRGSGELSMWMIASMAPGILWKPVQSMATDLPLEGEAQEDIRADARSLGECDSATAYAPNA